MSAEDLIDAYLEQLRLTGRSASTIYQWAALLRRADRELPFGLDAAGELELQHWLNRPGLSAGSRASYDVCLRSFYRFACSSRCPDELVLNPMDEIPPPRTHRLLPRPVTDEQLATIIERARDPFYLWCVLAAFGALRCIEISRLDREHVTAQSMRLHGKGDRRRVVPTHELVWDAVRNLPPGPVARDHAGVRLTARQVSNRAFLYLKGIGLEQTSMHRLRHWCLSNIQREVGNLRVTQEIAGHASPATTAVYTLVDDEQRTAAIRGLRRPTANGGWSAAAAADGPGRGA